MKRLEVAPNFSEVGTARRFVRSGLSSTAPVVADDMQLMVSELVSNAIEHGAPDQVAVELIVTADEVVLSVQSSGLAEQLPPTDLWTVASAADLSGRGLGIVRDLSDSVQVQLDENSLTVTVHRRLTPSAPQ